MQSSPNRSESASTTTLPVPVRRGRRSAARPATEAVAWVRASTRRRSRAEIVVARYRQAALTRASRSPSRPRPPSLELGEDPARRAEVVLVVLDGVVLEVQPEAREQLVEVVAVLLLLGLAEHDQPAAAARRTPRSRRAPRRSAAASRCRSSAPTRVRRMRDHEHARSRAAPRAVSGPSTLGTTRSRARPARPRRARTRSRRDGPAASSRASSGRIVHASLWASSNRTRASVPDRSWLRAYLAPPAVVDAEIDVICCNKSPSWTPQIVRFLRCWSKTAGAPTTTSPAASSLSAPAVKRRVDRLRARGALAGLHRRHRPRRARRPHRGADRAVLRARDAARRRSPTPCAATPRSSRRGA